MHTKPNQTRQIEWSGRERKKNSTRCSHLNYIQSFTSISYSIRCLFLMAFIRSFVDLWNYFRRDMATLKSSLAAEITLQMRSDVLFRDSCFIQFIFGVFVSFSIERKHISGLYIPTDFRYFNTKRLWNSGHLLHLSPFQMFIISTLNQWLRWMFGSKRFSIA